MNVQIEKAEDCSYIKLFDEEDLTEFRNLNYPDT